MRITEKWLGYNHSVYKGKREKCDVTIDQTSDKKQWYFYLKRKEDNLRYNSLDEGKQYESLNVCVEQAELWIEQNA